VAAKKPPVFARARTNHGAYTAYGQHVQQAGLRTLDLLGRRGAANARRLMTRVRSGDTKRSIHYRREGQVVSIAVGTMAGAVQEFGRGPGKRGGPIPALGFLRRGMGEALDEQMLLLRQELRKRKVSARRTRPRRGA
jgi:hypothetical protein